LILFVLLRRDIIGFNLFCTTVQLLFYSTVSIHGTGIYSDSDFDAVPVLPVDASGVARGTRMSQLPNQIGL
jgi:hypothetical protein